MTPSETNQMAAARMVAATLHNALKELLDSGVDVANGWPEETVKRMNDVLDHNEPAVLATLPSAEREAKVRTLLRAAKDVTECARGTEDEELCAAIVKLEQAHKLL